MNDTSASDRFRTKLATARQAAQPRYSEVDLKGMADGNFGPLWHEIEDLKAVIKDEVGPDASISRQFSRVDTNNGIVHGEFRVTKPGGRQTGIGFKIQGRLIHMEDEAFQFKNPKTGMWLKSYTPEEAGRLRELIEDQVVKFLTA